MAFDPATVAQIINPAGDPTFSVAATMWHLTDYATGAEVSCPASSVSAPRDSTAESETGFDGSTILLPGVVTAPEYAVRVTVTSTAAETDLVAVLSADRLLLRGPHGQRDWVQPVGAINVTQVDAGAYHEPPGALGADAEVPYLAVITVRLAIDDRWQG